MLLTTQGQLPLPPRNGAQAGSAQFASTEIYHTALNWDQHLLSAPRLLMPPVKVSVGLQSLWPVKSIHPTASASDQHLSLSAQLHCFFLAGAQLSNCKQPVVTGKWQQSVTPDLGRTDASHIPREISAGAEYHCGGEGSPGWLTQPMQRLPHHTQCLQASASPCISPKQGTWWVLDHTARGSMEISMHIYVPWNGSDSISHTCGKYTDPLS